MPFEQLGEPVEVRRRPVGPAMRNALAGFPQRKPFGRDVDQHPDRLRPQRIAENRLPSDIRLVAGLSFQFLQGDCPSGVLPEQPVFFQVVDDLFYAALSAHRAHWPKTPFRLMIVGVGDNDCRRRRATGAARGRIAVLEGPGPSPPPGSAPLPGVVRCERQRRPARGRRWRRGAMRRLPGCRALSRAGVGEGIA